MTVGPPTLVHTPYDGSSKPFTIGLRPLDLAGWLEIDATYDAQMREKRRLYATIPADVLVEEADTADAQREVLDLIRAEVTARHPGRFRAECKGIAVAGHPAVTADLMREAPLKAASLLVQEDLILMRRGADGWRLAAGSLCFPSSWSLSEKFGRPLSQIHIPVPGFGPGSRTEDLILRIFDKLQVTQPVERMNWSIQADDRLYHPLSSNQRDDRARTRPSRFPDGDIAAHAFIRIERQTLRKLPRSGDILFTIRIYLDPLAKLAAHPEKARLAPSFAAQLEALDTAQLDYKGLTADRDALVALLRRMAA